MRRIRPLVCSLVLVACDSPSAPPPPVDPAITVSASSFTIQRVQDLYRVDIPFVFKNRETEQVANGGCRPPLPPMVQWWNGTQWSDAYDYFEELCLTIPPFVVDTGGTYADTMHVAVFTDSINPGGGIREPYWLGPRWSAYYRLVWTVCDYHVGGSTLGFTCGPAIQEVSAPFRMEIANP